MNLSIGELSDLTAVKVPTIRYYEQVGLLPEPVRTEGRQRRYGDSEVKLLHFIRHARELGFEMDDIRELLDLAARPNQSCHEVDSIALRNLAAIERRIRQLEALKGELRRMVDECRHGHICECRVIEILADHGQCRHDHR
jgi:DNA-binding transcriptional MerR regulator